MCGICGVVSLRGSAVDASVLDAMNEALVHRGPDSAGRLIDGPVGFAMRRLAIIDLAGGDQPIANEDGSIQVIQNGEIYNYRSLRAELERAGHRLATQSDTEVLVHLYEEHGDAFVERLRGMFALAIWDRRERRVLLARDRYAIKPLYYRVGDGDLSFASELKALLRQPAFTREIDLEGLDAFLSFNSIPAPRTIFAEARKLPAGHLLVASLDDGSVDIRRYARPAPQPIGGLRRETEDELAAELAERLADSVRAHLVADVPVGVFLSGGVDSSTLVALAAVESPEPLRTFSIGFEERSFNELENARKVVARYQTDHRELVMRPNMVELLPKVVAAFDEPFADSSALPTYLVSELASRDVKVVLSGEGGDELFGGYQTYVADQLAPRWGKLAAAARPLIELLPSSTAQSAFDYRAKRFARGALLPPLERHQAWREVYATDARAELLSVGDDGRPDPIEICRARYGETEGAEQLARLQDIDFGVYLADDLLVKTDRATMAHSLEARVPYLDSVVTDFAFSIPSRMKVRRFAKKRLLRRAVAPLLPAEVISGPKRGFSIPAAAWLRGELAGFARDVLSPNEIRRQGFFKPTVVSRLLDEHISGRHDRSRQLWSLLVFGLWFDRLGRTGQ